MHKTAVARSQIGAVTSSRRHLRDKRRKVAILCWRPFGQYDSAYLHVSSPGRQVFEACSVMRADAVCCRACPSSGSPPLPGERVHRPRVRIAASRSVEQRVRSGDGRF